MSRKCGEPPWTIDRVKQVNPNPNPNPSPSPSPNPNLTLHRRQNVLDKGLQSWHTLSDSTLCTNSYVHFLQGKLIIVCTELE